MVGVVVGCDHDIDFFDAEFFEVGDDEAGCAAVTAVDDHDVVSLDKEHARTLADVKEVHFECGRWVWVAVVWVGVVGLLGATWRRCRVGGRRTV